VGREKKHHRRTRMRVRVYYNIVYLLQQSSFDYRTSKKRARDEHIPRKRLCSVYTVRTFMGSDINKVEGWTMHYKCVFTTRKNISTNLGQGKKSNVQHDSFSYGHRNTIYRPRKIICNLSLLRIIYNIRSNINDTAIHDIREI